MIKNILFLDLETFYDRKNGYSLNKMTTPAYILDRRFELILCAAYDIRWPTPKILLASELADFLRQYPAAETMACSHNALFDMSVLAWRYTWVPGLLQDTLGMSRALLQELRKHSLAAVSEHLGLGKKGETIIKVDGMHAADIRKSGLWSEYCNYALDDVDKCAKIYFKLLPKFPVEERKIMDLVLRCAVVPKFHADLPLLQSHLARLRKDKEILLKKCGYEKAQLMSTNQFKSALEKLGVEIEYKQGKNGLIPAFAKTDLFMERLLEHDDYPVQVLAEARLAHKSTLEETRTEKFYDVGRLPWGNGAMLPVALRYGGAHTHRLSGEWGMNMQNLPRKDENLPPEKVSRLRYALTAPAGYKVVTADLSQIEARLVAWLCHEHDLLEQFRSGEDVYSNFGRDIFHRYCSKKDTPHERFIAKTAVLGLGYGCGVERFYLMVTSQARRYGIDLGDLFDINVARKTVGTYRRRFARISSVWQLLDVHLARILNNGSTTQKAPLGPVTLRSGAIRLPNGMDMTYQIPDHSLYGAHLLENIIQALARIVVMQASLRLASLGLRFALQSHDELVFLVPDEKVFHVKQTVQQQMVREPSWAKGVPLAVEIGVGQSYGEAK